MKLIEAARGVFPIAPTPFHGDGRIDDGSIDRLTAHWMGIGADGATVLGIMGEAPKLTGAESAGVARRYIRGMAGRPVIVGVSSPGFAAMRELAHQVMADGAAGVMIAPPPHLRTDDEILAYFAGAAEAIGPDVPWVLQDYPLTLTVVMTPAVIRRIVTDNPGLRDAQARGLARP